MVAFKTERLIIRSAKLGDSKHLFAYERDNREYIEVNSQTRVADYYTEQYIASVVERFVAEQHVKTGQHFFVFHQDEPETIIGRIDLSEIILAPTLLCCWLGYSLDYRWQKQGLMQEALQPVLDFAFGETGLHRIEAGVKPSNVASQRVLERAGFVREGLCRKNVEINGEWQDHYLYAMLADGFLK